MKAKNIHARKTLSFISKAGTFMVVFSSLWLVQYFTLGYIPWLRDAIIFELFYLKEVLFIATSLLLMALFVRIGDPHA